jgi:type II secretory pathway component PulF
VISIPPSEWALFYKLLAHGLAAGHSPAESLSQLAREPFSRKLKTRLPPRLAQLPPGASLADCLKLKLFALDAATLGLFEKADRDEDRIALLHALSARYARESWLKRLRGGALYWPVIYFVFLGFMTALIVTFVLPELALVYEDLNGGLPEASALLMANRHGVIGLLALLALLVLALNVRPAPLRGLIDAIRLIPPWGIGGKKIALSRFTHMLAALLAKNTPARFALPLAAASVENVVIGRRLQNALAQAAAAAPDAGASPSVAGILNACPLVPAAFAAALGLAEKTGKLEETLPELEQWSADKLRRQMQFLNTAIQVTSIMIGILLGFWVVASVYMPIFKLGAVV